MPQRLTVLLTTVPLLDELLERYAPALGQDFTGYRNHAYRVMNFCAALVRRGAETTRRKIAIAAGFHDLGIWTDHTFDYVPPSERWRTATWCKLVTLTGRPRSAP